MSGSAATTSTNLEVMGGKPGGNQSILQRPCVTGPRAPPHSLSLLGPPLPGRGIVVQWKTAGEEWDLHSAAYQLASRP